MGQSVPLSPASGLNSPTVFVIDDEPDIRALIERLCRSVSLDVQTFTSPLEFLSSYDGRRPGCIVLDIVMPGMSGLEAQQHFTEARIELPVIILSGYGDVPSAVRGIKAGAVEFFQKPVSMQLLLERMQACITADTQRARLTRERDDMLRRLAALSERERQVLQHIIEGLSSREIGQALGISVKTVGIHRSNLLRKSGARSTGQLVGMAFAADGIISETERP